MIRLTQNELKGRRTTRLAGYDYTQPGAYFVTICSYRKERILSKISMETINLSPIGLIVDEELHRTSILRGDIVIDRYVIMPNHVHAIIQILEGPTPVGAHRDAPLHRPGRSLGSIIGQFKGSVTLRVRKHNRDPDYRVWQRNYYEHVIRDEKDLNRIRRYIQDNPAQWHVDQYYLPGT
jgi:REP element-mobilizing transposase RayT